jgi:hypothetical protein
VKCLFPYRKNCVDEMDCPMMLKSKALAGAKTRRRILAISTDNGNALERPQLDFDGIRSLSLLFCLVNQAEMGVTLLQKTTYLRVVE